MTRSILALLVFFVCTALTWSLSLRYFASWAQICFQEGPGWEIGLAELFGRASWNTDLAVSSLAPYLPLLLFAGPRQKKARQFTMMGGMLGILSINLFLGSPASSDLCDTKGPFPEIGYLFLGVFVSVPLALGLAWLTRSDKRTVQS